MSRRAAESIGLARKVSHLPPAMMQRLAAAYVAARDRWRASGRIADARRRLERLARTAAELAEVTGDLRSVDLRLAGLTQDQAAELMTRAAQQAAAAQRGLRTIAAGRGDRGGNRPAEALLAAPPRAALAAALRDELGAVTTRVLLDSLAEVLAQAGEDDPRGLEDVIRSLPRRENLPSNGLGSPIAESERAA